MTPPKPAPPQEPTERSWSIPCFYFTERNERIYDSNAVALAMAEAQGILFRLGGVMQMGTKREVFPAEGDLPERTETTMIYIQWQAFVKRTAATAPPAPAEAPPAE